MTAHEVQRQESHTPAVTTIFADGDIPDHIAEMSEDEAVLASLGYKQEFKRDFGHLELFGMSFSIVGVVQGIA